MNTYQNDIKAVYLKKLKALGDKLNSFLPDESKAYRLNPVEDSNIHNLMLAMPQLKMDKSSWASPIPFDLKKITKGRKVRYSLEYENMRDVIGGLVDFISLANGWTLVVGDESLIDGSLINPLASALATPAQLFGERDPLTFARGGLVCGVAILVRNSALADD